MRFGGILLAAALILGGCTDDPAPREPTKTASSPHPSSTLKPPVMPEQAKEDSPEGAAAFVTHWVAVFNYAAATGDVNELSNLSSPGCEGCQRYIDLLRTTYEAGGYYQGGEWSLGTLKISGNGRDVVARTTLHMADGTRTEAAGKEPVHEKATDVAVGFALPAKAPWRIDQYFLGEQQ